MDFFGEKTACRKVRWIRSGLFYWLLGLMSQDGISQHLRDKFNLVHHHGGNHIFHYNPASNKTDKGIVSVFQGSSSCKATAKGVSGQREEVLRFDCFWKTQAAGILVPIDGAAFGIKTIQMVQDHTTLFQENRSYKEKFGSKDWEFHFLVDLTDLIRAGFVYRYTSIDETIYGGYFIDSQDFTRVKGTMTGYRLGFSYTSRFFEVGVYNGSSLRGKSEIYGEQKILSDPGRYGASLHLGHARTLGFGLFTETISYKKNDRASLSTSPMDQRKISLRGLNLMRFFYPLQRSGLQISTLLRPGLTGVLGVTAEEGKMNFSESLPQNNDEQKMVTNLLYEMSLALSKDKLSIGLYGWTRRNRISSFKDRLSTFGFQEYQGLKDQTTAMMVSLGYVFK